MTSSPPEVPVAKMPTPRTSSDKPRPSLPCCRSHDLSSDRRSHCAVRPNRGCVGARYRRLGQGGLAPPMARPVARELEAHDGSSRHRFGVRVQLRLCRHVRRGEQRPQRRGGGRGRQDIEAARFGLGHDEEGGGRLGWRAGARALGRGGDRGDPGGAARAGREGEVQRGDAAVQEADESGRSGGRAGVHGHPDGLRQGEDPADRGEGGEGHGRDAAGRRAQAFRLQAGSPGLRARGTAGGGAGGTSAHGEGGGHAGYGLLRDGHALMHPRADGAGESD
mmetsp:Transcript_27188/g.73429  ORF Transcript_27188/g.73429 Transcript_27188/m.73429 type:complete len:278 (-) Transcript_27188:1106-1939(-)